MIRSWAVTTLNGSAQPVFGDVTTAALAATDGSLLINVPVASTTRYEAGDRIVIDPELATQDTLLVDHIVSGTVLACRSEGNKKTNAHTTSAIIQLSIACSQILTQGFSLSANVYFGSDNTVTNAGGGSAFGYIYPAGAYSIGNPQYNCQRTSDIWMAGKNADTIGVAAIVL